jgi:hypothetical protein
LWPLRLTRIGEGECGQESNHWPEVVAVKTASVVKPIHWRSCRITGQRLWPLRPRGRSAPLKSFKPNHWPEVVAVKTRGTANRKRGRAYVESPARIDGRHNSISKDLSIPWVHANRWSEIMAVKTPFARSFAHRNVPNLENENLTANSFP